MMTTKSNPSNPAANSSSSDEMVASSRKAKVLDLGRKLVQELEPVDDTLVRWMAHYLAELISALESATEHDRERLARECFDTILKLWSQRKSLPCDNRPLESFEPIFRQIESMNPTYENLRYFSRPPYQRDDESDETLGWLQAAESCDEAARAVVRFCLAQATRSALNKEAEWVQLAQSSATVDLLELESFERLSDLASYLLPEHVAQMPEYQRKSMRIKLEQLSENTSTLIRMLDAGSGRDQ